MSRVCCQLGSESRPAVSYPGAIPRRRENDERKSPASMAGLFTPVSHSHLWVVRIRFQHLFAHLSPDFPRIVPCGQHGRRL